MQGGKKKRNLGIPKGSEYWSLSAPQEEHLAAQAKDTSSLLPADQELPGQSRAEPCIATDCIPLLFLCSMAFSEWVSLLLQGWKSLPCELSHCSARQPPLQLRCHRHDSGRPAPVTPHYESDDWFSDLGNFLCYVLPEGSSGSFSRPGLGNAAVVATALLSPTRHPYIGPMLCYLVALRRLNFKEERLLPGLHLSPSLSSQESC